MGKENQLKFLLVEDEPIAQIVAQIIVEKAEYSLDLAESASKALKLIKNNQYNIILLDLGLPDMSGIDLAKKIIEKIKTPIIAITAFNSEQKKHECIIAGFKDFVEKPLTENKLRTIVKNFIH